MSFIRNRKTKTAVLVGGLLLVLFAAAFQMHRLHYDDRLYYWLQMQRHADAEHADEVWLADYHVAVEAKPVPSITHNLSGLTFDPDREQLWAVTNGPNELFALTRAGEVTGRYPLEGFHDVEGVSYFGEGRLAITEERRQGVVIVTLPEQAGPLRREDFPSLTLDLGEGDNKGFEGLAYDLAGDRLYVAKERDPLLLYEITGLKPSLAGDFTLGIRDVTPSIRRGLFATDLSSVVFDARTGHLVLLSDESRLLIELDKVGKVVSYASLASGIGGLDEGIPQAEGVALDAQGNLYVISEPNLFYRFERR